ncbi:MAG: VOC family protein [Proteobacteria bacterium]|nr:VOC family protein [Pseudomonadota bacterium]
MFLEHVNLTVTDLDRSTDYYCQLLDFKVRWQGRAISEEGTVRACHVGNDRFYLALFEAEQPGQAPADYAHAGINHFGFVVEDLAAVRKRAVDLGSPPHFEPEYDPGPRIYVRDPDGIEVELVQAGEAAG